MELIHLWWLYLVTAIANVDLVLQGAGGTIDTDEIFGNGFN